MLRFEIEAAAAVHAFVQAGWAPQPALANVVDGTAEAVYQLIPGDPHPIPLIRVLFNAALCRHWFGAGPWDDLAAAWAERHPPSHAPADAGAMARLSVAALDDIVRVCTRQPMAAFRDQPLCALADPRHVAPLALETLARQAGPSLLTSQYLARREPLAILAWLSTRAFADPAHAGAHRLALEGWLARLSPEPQRHAA
jgi:hypothetical protein